MSELAVGLIYAIKPLAYVYPIILTTITDHHLEFTNSPVPIFLGFWGETDLYKSTKNYFKKSLKNQKALSPTLMQKETPLAVIDIEDHTV